MSQKCAPALAQYHTKENTDLPRNLDHDSQFSHDSWSPTHQPNNPAWVHTSLHEIFILQQTFVGPALLTTLDMFLVGVLDDFRFCKILFSQI